MQVSKKKLFPKKTLKMALLPHKVTDHRRRQYLEATLHSFGTQALTVKESELSPSSSSRFSTSKTASVALNTEKPAGPSGAPFVIHPTWPRGQRSRYQSRHGNFSSYFCAVRSCEGSLPTGRPLVGDLLTNVEKGCESQLKILYECQGLQRAISISLLTARFAVDGSNTTISNAVIPLLTRNLSCRSQCCAFSDVGLDSSDTRIVG